MQIKVGEKTNCDLVCKYDDDAITAANIQTK